MRKIALLGLLSASGMIASAAKNPPTFHIRLDVPLTSYDSPAGTAFTATVISPLEIGGQSIIPQGSLIHGTVIRASAVGLGLVHERAMLELAFHEYELAEGHRYPFGARLEFVENAREQVDSRGRIKGVLAASNPQGLLRGIWYRPSDDFFSRSAIGLTGLGGALWSHFSLGPVGAAGMLAARYIAFPLPEPEIQLPSGTEMRLLATSIPEDAPSTPVLPNPSVGESLAAWLQTQSRAVTRPDGTPAADVVNLAFIGNAEELQNAFTAAGWVAAEPRTLHSLSTTYRAYNSMRGYSTAPVSTLLYQQAEPMVVFQKSFNTIAKRHHIRIWRAGLFEGNEVWVGAATQDAGVGFQRRSRTITHKIDPQTDRERRKVVMDLSFAACSQRVSFLDRSPDAEAAAEAAQDTWIQTDGRLAVIWLQQCAGNYPDDDSPMQSPGSKTKRMARRFILETRQYFLRDNMYYWVYRATRLGLTTTFRGTSNAE
ncbi:MAG: LssY C-terminal domain-containing protein [Acidobacteriia bacterium]|nr:LssY C-terminal domain-containing protein [Terriglobia bacterium]